MVAEELIKIVETVWQSTIGCDLIHHAEASPPAPQGTLFTATIYFEGAWAGLLMTTCSENLARTIASAMFQLPPEESSAEDVRDAVGEMVNILGGNLKAILPKPCKLSLPAVFDGDMDEDSLVPKNCEVVDMLHFESDGELLTVRLIKDEAAISAKAS